MKLTEIIVRRPVSAIVIILGIVLFGLMSVFGMTQELLPEMSFPQLLVGTTFPGAGPEDVEKLVTNPIEGAVSSLSGVTDVYSFSMEGASGVAMLYEYGTDMDNAYADVVARLEMINNALPEDAIKPIVIEIDMNAMETMSLSARSQNSDSLLRYIEDEVVPELEKLSSVADVSVYGGREEYIRVELLEDKLLQYRVSMNQISEALRSADFSMPGGVADHGSQSLNVTSSVRFRTVKALENIPLSLGNGNTIRLSDVAVIHHATKDAESISRYNGEENISFGIQKRQSASAVTVSRQVRAAIDAINANGDDIYIDIINDNSESIQDSIMTVAQTMLLSIVISMVILYLFLGDVKASLIVGSSMPVSLLVAFVLMSFMGFTLNVVTMSAMVLGVGMMVDNSIVVLDSCFKSRGRDSSFADSALKGTKFVLGSIAGSTVTTVVVFFPLATLKGMSGQLFTPLGFTIIFALTASLFSAMTLTPLFFVQFRPRERKHAIGNKMISVLEKSYASLLRRILNRKVLATVVSAVMIVICTFLATKINMELMPGTDQGIISMSVETRPGLNLDKLDEILVDLEAIVKEQPDVDHYTARTAAGGLSGLMGGGGTGMTVYLKEDRKLKTDEIVDIFREQTKDWLSCDVTVSSQSMTASFASEDITVYINGKDLDTLKTFIRDVEEEVSKNPDVLSVTSNLAMPTPQAELIVDSMKASAVGFTPYQVASNVNAVLSGSQAAELLMSDDRHYKIRVEYPEGKYTSVGDLSNLILMSPTGAQVPLLDIASIEFTDTPQTIERQNNQYVMTVTVTPRSDARFAVQEDVNARVAAMPFPHNVELAENEEQQMMMDEFYALGMAIVTSIFLVFMVMAIQFESIKHSLMVMICIPFSMIGSIALMYVTGTTISMTSLLGVLILVGTVVNNGILFVDSANQYRKSMDIQTALVYTGQNRLRPILMTTLTTVLSMVPMLFASGSAAMMRGLATVVIGGLTVSTILTLLLLPTFYLIIEGSDAKKAKRTEKKRQKQLRELEKEFGSEDGITADGLPPVIPEISYSEESWDTGEPSPEQDDFGGDESEE